MLRCSAQGQAGGGGSQTATNARKARPAKPGLERGAVEAPLGIGSKMAGSPSDRMPVSKDPHDPDTAKLRSIKTGKEHQDPHLGCTETHKESIDMGCNTSCSSKNVVMLHQQKN